MKALLIVVITVVVINALFVIFAYHQGCALEEMRRLDHGETRKGARK
nr:MAG TPA: hypothetical protein [Caudoviricetes sp.]